MQGDFKKLKSELSSKKVNNLPKFKHIMAYESNKFNEVEFSKILDDLKSFLSLENSNLCDYEKWLEEFCGRDKKG